MSFIDRCREARRAGAEDEGFTLIELLVVLLIIGILLAIAIPTFLSVTKGANNTAAQSNLQTALTGADTYYTNSQQSYTGLDGGVAGVSTITQIDTGLTWVTHSAAAVSNHTISAQVSGSGNVLVMTTYSPGTNDCWGVLDIKSTQTSSVLGQSATGTYYFVADRGTATKGTCTADAMAALKTGFTINASSFPAG